MKLREIYERARGSEADEIESASLVGRLNATVAVVPGAFHRAHRHTGADGSVIREEAERLGARSALISLPDLAPVRDNARQICDWLRRRDVGPVILVSLSKGSSDVRAALDDRDAFRHVVAWVNVSGALDGSPLVDWLFAGTIRSYWTLGLLYLRGHDLEAIREQRHDPRPFTVPPHVRTVHVIGFPEREHLGSTMARRWHSRIAHLGPNDGCGLLLADVLNWPGIVYPVWGADHYLAERRDLIRSVLSYLACKSSVFGACHTSRSSVLTERAASDQGGEDHCGGENRRAKQPRHAGAGGACGHQGDEERPAS